VLIVVGLLPNGYSQLATWAVISWLKSCYF